MDIQNSANIKNHIKIKSFLIAAGAYLFATIFTAGIFLVYALITTLISTGLLNKEIREFEPRLKSNRFKKSLPFSIYGESYGSFQHVFYHEDSLKDVLFNKIGDSFKKKTSITKLERTTMTDIDDDLSNPEERDFLVAQSDLNYRGTTVTLIIRSSDFGKMQSIHWWALAGGYIDKNKKFNFLAYSPLSLPFWIISYIKKEYDILSNVRTVYSSTFNEIDITTETRCIHELVFDAMISVLEDNGIDTIELRAQKMQAMSINISDSKVKMGNIVQGAMNKISSSMGGRK